MNANRFFQIVSCFALVPAALFCAGCGGKDSGSGASPNGGGAPASVKVDTADFLKSDVRGKHGDGFVELTVAPPKTFNPLLVKETSSGDILGLVFDSLVGRRSDTLKRDPALASAYTVSPDGRTWTFKLRKGVKWSDGEPFTADDVIFTFDAIYDEKVFSSTRDVLLLDGKPAKYKKIDDYTVEFELPYAFGPFLDTFAGTLILPKHKLEADWKAGKLNSSWTVSTAPSEIVGTNAFTLAEFKTGQYVKFKRNPYFWKLDADGKQMPFFDAGNTEIVPDINTMTLKFKSGEGDYVGLRPQDWSEFTHGEATGDYKTDNAGPTWGINYLSFNQNPRSKTLEAYKRDWFSKKEFRQAMAYAIDRDAMVQTVFRGLARPLWSPVSEANKVYYSDKIMKYPYDIAKAKALLAGMGFTPGPDGYLKDSAGHTLEFTLTTNSENNLRVTMCTIIQDSLKKIGVKVDLAPQQFNSLVEKLNSSFDWDAVVMGLTGGVEPYNSKVMWTTTGILHVWNPQQKSPATPWEAEVDKIFAEAGRTVDDAKRKPLYDRFQEIVTEQQPLVFLVTPDALYAVRKRLTNTKPTSLGGVRWNLDEISAQ